MEARVNKSDLLTALAALKPYQAQDNMWPFTSFAVRDGSLLVYGTDRNAFTCTAVAAEIKEDSEAVGLVSQTLETLVKTTQGETIVLRSTDQNLFVEDDYRFKARLARSNEMPSLIDQFLEAKEKASTEISATFTKEGLSRLLSLSNAFPPHTNTGKRWCLISVDSGVYSGSVQDTEAGAIESLPLEASYENAEVAGTISFSTKLFQPILQQADSHITLQAGLKRNSQVIVSDPAFPSWFTIFAQYLRPGESFE
jgi:hypothetical protein